MVKKLAFGGSIWGGPWGDVVPPNYVKIFVSQISTDIKKNWHPSLSRSKIWFFGGSPGGWYPQTMSKYFSLKYLLISKKTGTLGYMVKKICFWGGPFGGVPGGMWYPQIMSKYLSLKYLLISKKTGTLAWAVQRIDFLGPHFGGVPGGVVPPNHV